MDMFKVVMDLFGTTILVPVVVFVLCLFIKVEVKKAFQGALFMGIGLAAFNIILGGLMGSLAPVVVEMVQNTGINLPTIDIGWPGAAMIVYANRIGLFYLVFGLGFSLILFLLKWTDSFHPTDIWNYYQFIFWGAIVELTTGSFWLGILTAMFLNLIILLLADWLAPTLQEYYGYDGITCTCFSSIHPAPFAVIILWLLKKLNLNKIDVNPEMIREKFGFWGEPVTMGVIIGFVITLIAKSNQLGTMEAWASILQTSVVTGAVMAVYPAVSGLFVKGLIPISQTLSKRLRSGELKRDSFNIAMDPAIFFGEESTLTSGLVLIPIVMVIAIFLPGSCILPLADLPALPFYVIGTVAVMRGNIFNTVISCGLWVVLGQWASSDIAAIFTQAAVNSGVELPVEGAMVSSWIIGSNPIAWVVYKAFAAPENIRIFTIAVAVVVYLIIFFLYKKNKRSWHIAAGASEEFLDSKVMQDSDKG